MIGTKSVLTIVRKFILLMVILMPIHNMVFATLIHGTIDNIWRDVLLIICIAISLLANNGRFSLGKLGVPILLSWIVCLIYMFSSDRPDVATNLARTYIMPTIIYFIIINSGANNKYINLIENIFVYVAVVLSIFGVFQAFVLGDSFLVKIGYSSLDGHLASNSFYISHFYGIQRTASTFASPNICGVYFGMAILILSTNFGKIKQSTLFMFILVLGLVTTFSRSAILGTVVALAVYHRRKLVRLRIKLRYVFILPIIIVIVILIDSIILNGLIANMIFSSFSSTAGMTDSSAIKHVSDLWEPIEEILANPWGLGFGHNGPIVAGQYTDVNLVESSIYLLMYDFGILGGVIFLLPYLNGLFHALGRNNLIYKGGTICILDLFTYLLLPNVETYELLFFTFLFIGMDEVRVSINKREKFFFNNNETKISD